MIAFFESLLLLHVCLFDYLANVLFCIKIKCLGYRFCKPKGFQLDFEVQKRIICSYKMLSLSCLLFSCYLAHAEINIIQLKATSIGKATPENFWEQFNLNDGIRPSQWKFIADKLDPEQVSFEEIAQYQVVFYNVSPGAPMLNKNQREKLRRFFSAGGVMWINLLTSENSHQDFLRSLPFPSLLSRAKSLKDLPQQNIDNDQSRIVEIANGKLLLTVSPNINPIHKKLFVNTIAQAQTKMVGLQPPMIKVAQQIKNFIYPPLFFKGRVLGLEQEDNQVRLKVYYLKHQKPFTFNKFIILDSDELVLLGQSIVLTNHLFPPTTCELSGNILLAQNEGTQLTVFSIDDFKFGKGAVLPRVEKSLDNFIMQKPTVFEGMAYIPTKNKEHTSIQIFNMLNFEFIADTRIDYESPQLKMNINTLHAPLQICYIPLIEFPGTHDLIIFCLVEDQRKNIGLQRLWIGARNEYAKAEVARFYEHDEDEDFKLFLETRARKQELYIYESNNSNHEILGLLPIVDLKYEYNNKVYQKRIFDRGPIFLHATEPILGIDLSKISDDWNFSKSEYKNIKYKASVDYNYFPTKNDKTHSLATQDANYQPEKNFIIAENGLEFIFFKNREGSGGTLKVLRFDNDVKYDTLLRWDLYDQINLKNLDKENIYQHPLIQKNPGIKNLNFERLPVRHKNKIYMIVSGINESNQPISIILGFKAHPGPLQTVIPSGVNKKSFLIEQDDPILPLKKVSLRVNEQQFNFTSKLITLDKLNTTNYTTSTISTSVPFYITNGSNKIYIEPEKDQNNESVFKPGFSNGRWSPVVFMSTMLNNSKILSQPLILGDFLYIVTLEGSEKKIKVLDLNKNFWQDIAIVQSESVEFTLQSQDEILMVYGNEDHSLEMFMTFNFLVAHDNSVAKMNLNGDVLWHQSRSIKEGSLNSFSQPSKIFQDVWNPDEYWIVNSGSNRIICMDSNGNETKEISEIQIDPNLPAKDMPAGVPLKLNNPKDLIVFSGLHNQENNPFSDVNSPEWWLHYLIADSENRRLIELVDRYDVSGIHQKKIKTPFSSQNLNAINMLYWQSSRSDYDLVRYQSIDLVRRPLTQKPLLIAGFLGEKDGIMIYDPELDKKLILNELPVKKSINQTIFIKKPIKDLQSCQIQTVKNQNNTYQLMLTILDEFGIHQLITQKENEKMFKDAKNKELLINTTQVLDKSSWIYLWEFTYENLRQLIAPSLKNPKILHIESTNASDIIVVYRANDITTFETENYLLLLKRDFITDENNRLFNIKIGQNYFAKLYESIQAN